MLALLAPVLGTAMSFGASTMNVVKANDWNFATARAQDFSVIESGGRKQYFIKVTGKSFDEVIPSWSARATNGSRLVFYVRPMNESASEFCLGSWGQGEAVESSRTSINDQEDEFSKVITDTWILKSPSDEFVVRVDSIPGPDGTQPVLDRLNFVLTGQNKIASPGGLPLRGTLLDVPLRAQMSYENGGVLCSPTSVSMILGYWAKRMETPTLDFDVPEVQKGVFDPAWKGTGNWPFNVAFAASQPGMTGYVTRLRSVQDIEAFVACGVPVATSVSYGHLKGKGKQNDDGHIVVIVGFQEDGTPIFNDPGRNVVRMTYPRADFERAWANSKNTVYIIHPRGWATPKNGPWPEEKRD